MGMDVGYNNRKELEGEAVLPVNFPVHNSHIPPDYNYKMSSAILKSPISLKKIQNQLTRGKIIITDTPEAALLPVFSVLKREMPPLEFLICLKNKHFASLDLVGLLDNYLHRTRCHPILLEQIITAAHEAFANALMWSSLDMEPIEGLRTSEFYEHYENRLADPHYANRLLSFYLARSSNLIEVAIFVEGNPIVWRENAHQESFRGIAIIKAFSDYIFFDPNGKGIRLFFFVPPEK